jgi:peptide/nickel transport system substrate-binding protein
MYTNGPSSPVPVNYMIGWYAGPGDAMDNIAQKSNGWQGQNFQRWINEDYDALYEELLTVTDAEQAAELIIQMNDILIEEVVVIPQVNRAADKYVISNNLRNENVVLSPFEFDYWNIANWNRPS